MKIHIWSMIAGIVLGGIIVFSYMADKVIDAEIETLAVKEQYRDCAMVGPVLPSDLN